MDKLYDFTFDKVLYRPLGGSDRKITVEHDGAVYMLKFATNHAKRDDMTTSHVNSVISEYIGSHISQSAGLDTQNTVIGLYNNEIVVGCQDFRKQGEQNYEFSELVHRVYDSDDIGRVIRYDQLYDTIEKTLPDDLKQPSIDRYWDTFIIDALVGNFDRHIGNWGYLVEPDGRLILSPIYDYGSTLLPQLSVKGCKDIINDEYKMLERCLVFPSPALFIGQEKSGKSGYYDLLSSGFDSNCTQALLRMQPRLDLDKINSIIDEIPELPEIKRQFLKKYIALRKEIIIDRAYEHCLNRDFDHAALDRIQQRKQYGTADLKHDIAIGKLHPNFKNTPVHNHFIMLAGIPGAGKQELGRQYFEATPGGVFVRTNDIRQELGISGNSPEENKQVFSTAYSRIKAALEDAKDVVYVATNLTKQSRKDILDIALDIEGIDTTLVVIYKNPAIVNADVPYEQLSKMAQLLHDNEPTYEEGWNAIEIYGEDPLQHNQNVSIKENAYSLYDDER